MELSAYTEFLRYAKLILKRKYLFIITSLCVMSVIVWGSYLLPNKYEAESTIFIESNVIEDLVKGIAITPSMNERIKVLRDIMLGRSLVLEVIRKLDLDAQTKNDKELEEMIARFQAKTKIRVKSGNDLIIVSYVSKNPMLARNYINTLVTMYVEKNIFAKREEAHGANKFLEDQVAYFKDKMDKSENDIIKFRQEKGIYIATDERSIIDDIKKYTAEIEGIKIKRNELSATIDSVNGQLGREPQTVAVLSSRDVQGTIESLEKRLMQLLTRYTENYPEVIRIKAEIETLKTHNAVKSVGPIHDGTPDSEISTINPVYQDLKRKSMTIEAELKSLNAREKYLQGTLDRKKRELKYIPEGRKMLADLERERDSFKNIYTKLLERLGQSEVSRQMEIEDKTTTFRIIEPAILPLTPVSPNRVMLILAGIVIGFFSGTGIVILPDRMDDSIKSIGSLKNFGLPVLAVIPNIPSVEDVVGTSKRDIILYAFSGFYMLCILAILILEVLGFQFMGNLMNNVLKPHL